MAQWVFADLQPDQFRGIGGIDRRHAGDRIAGRCSRGAGEIAEIDLGDIAGEPRDPCEPDVFDLHRPVDHHVVLARALDGERQLVGSAAEVFREEDVAGDGCLIDGKQRQRLSELLAVGADHQRVVEAELRASHVEREKGSFLRHIPFVGARGAARRKLQWTGERGDGRRRSRLFGREKAHVIELDHRPDRPTAA